MPEYRRQNADNAWRAASDHMDKARAYLVTDPAQARRHLDIAKRWERAAILWQA